MEIIESRPLTRQGGKNKLQRSHYTCGDALEQFRTDPREDGIKLQIQKFTKIFEEIIDRLEYNEPVTFRVDVLNSKGEVLGRAWLREVNHD